MYIETFKLWEDREDVELTTFITLPDPIFPDKRKKPAVIVCAGGSYLTCSRHSPEGDQAAMVFASEGYQAFVLEYSVRERAPEGKVLFPAQILDYGKAILTIREHADEWCVDMSKISIIGFSAGAHLCGMIATTWHEKLLSDYFGEKSEVFKPLCAMLLYPITDYRIQNEHLRNNFIPVYPIEANNAVFGCVNPSEEEEIKNSPVCHVSENTCPIFIAAATDDMVVPSVQSLDLAKALHNKNIPYELHMFEFGNHGFALGQYIPESYRYDKKHANAKWIEMAKVFLMHKIADETTITERLPFGEIPS